MTNTRVAFIRRNGASDRGIELHFGETGLPQDYRDPHYGTAVEICLEDAGRLDIQMILPAEAELLHAFLGRFVQPKTAPADEDGRAQQEVEQPSYAKAEVEQNRVKLPDFDFDYAADMLTEIDALLVEEMDLALSSGTVPGKPESILRDLGDRPHYARRLVRLADLSRRVRALRADLPANERI